MLWSKLSLMILTNLRDPSSPPATIGRALARGVRGQQRATGMGSGTRRAWGGGDAEFPCFWGWECPRLGLLVDTTSPRCRARLVPGFHPPASAQAAAASPACGCWRRRGARAAVRLWLGWGSCCGAVLQPGREVVFGTRAATHRKSRGSETWGFTGREIREERGRARRGWCLGLQPAAGSWLARSPLARSSAMAGGARWVPSVARPLGGSAPLRAHPAPRCRPAAAGGSHREKKAQGRWAASPPSPKQMVPPKRAAPSTSITRAGWLTIAFQG